MKCTIVDSRSYIHDGLTVDEECIWWWICVQIGESKGEAFPCLAEDGKPWQC